MRRLLVSAIVAVAIAAGPGAGLVAAGTLVYDLKLEGHWQLAECPTADGRARCFKVDYEGLWPGIGPVQLHEEVLQSGDTDADLCEPQTRHETLTSTRGTIEWIARGIDCPATRELLGGYRAVIADAVAVRGTGAFAGVIGTGGANVRPDEDEVYTHFQGSLSVPELEFDTTAPVISRVPRSMSLRSPGPAVVRYAAPAAHDAVDGAVPVRCTPASGRRFRMGRTVVRCEAVDSSGNRAAATFAVIVRRHGR
jgi:HYR domain